MGLHRAEFKNEYRIRKLTDTGEPTIEQARAAVRSIVETAKERSRRGVREDRMLYAFERDVERISDSLQTFSLRGMHAEYEDLYGQLYRFVQSFAGSRYMPLCLFVLYRYANAVLLTGKAEKALALYRELLRRTEDMIGTDNPYGVRCWDKIGTAAAAAGLHEEARKAYEEALRIAERNYGLYSPFTQAVQHRLAGVQEDEKAACTNRKDLYRKSSILLGEGHALTQQCRKEYVAACHALRQNQYKGDERIKKTDSRVQQEL